MSMLIYRKRLERRRLFLETLQAYEQEISRYEKEAAQLQKQLKEKQTGYRFAVDDFNDNYFTPMAARINGEKPLLVYNTKHDAFPVGLRRLNEGTSMGTRKSLIAAYDLAYQSFARNMASRCHVLWFMMFWKALKVRTLEQRLRKQIRSQVSI